jgi:hypothetical protein
MNGRGSKRLLILPRRHDEGEKLYNVGNRHRPWGVSCARSFSFWRSNDVPEKRQFSVVKPNEHDRLPQVKYDQIPPDIAMPYYAQTGNHKYECILTRES